MQLSSLYKQCAFTLKKCRLNRPIGIVLLLIPCLWGYVWQTASIKAWDCALLAFGALWMRSVGCAYNDWIDQRFDFFVHRTKKRGLWHFSIFQILNLGTLILLPGLFLWFCLPFRTILWGMAGWLLSLLYPFLKRWVLGPQIFLGFLFSWGVWIGASLTSPLFQKDLIFFFILGILWTIEYDTIYAYQDKKEDLQLGLKSLAVLWDQKGKVYLMTGLGLRILMLSGWCQHLTSHILLWSYGILWARQLKRLDLNTSSSCNTFFKYSWITGLVILILIILERRV